MPAGRCTRDAETVCVNDWSTSLKQPGFPAVATGRVPVGLKADLRDTIGLPFPARPGCNSCAEKRCDATSGPIFESFGLCTRRVTLKVACGPSAGCAPKPEPVCHLRVTRAAARGPREDLRRYLGSALARQAATLSPPAQEPLWTLNTTRRTSSRTRETKEALKKACR